MKILKLFLVLLALACYICAVIAALTVILMVCQSMLGAEERTPPNITDVEGFSCEATTATDPEHKGVFYRSRANVRFRDGSDWPLTLGLHEFRQFTASKMKPARKEAETDCAKWMDAMTDKLFPERKEKDGK